MECKPPFPTLSELWTKCRELVWLIMHPCSHADSLLQIKKIYLYILCNWKLLTWSDANCMLKIIISNEIDGSLWWEIRSQSFQPIWPLTIVCPTHVIKMVIAVVHIWNNNYKFSIYYLGMTYSHEMRSIWGTFGNSFKECHPPMYKTSGNSIAE